MLCAWCIYDFCHHCVFVFVVSVCEDSFISRDPFFPGETVLISYYTLSFI